MFISPWGLLLSFFKSKIKPGAMVFLSGLVRWSVCVCFILMFIKVSSRWPVKKAIMCDSSVRQSASFVGYSFAGVLPTRTISLCELTFATCTLGSKNTSPPHSRLTWRAIDLKLRARNRCWNVHPRAMLWVILVFRPGVVLYAQCVVVSEMLALGILHRQHCRIYLYVQHRTCMQQSLVSGAWLLHLAYLANRRMVVVLWKGAENWKQMYVMHIKLPVPKAFTFKQLFLATRWHTMLHTETQSASWYRFFEVTYWVPRVLWSMPRDPWQTSKLLELLHDYQMISSTQGPVECGRNRTASSYPHLVPNGASIEPKELSWHGASPHSTLHGKILVLFYWLSHRAQIHSYHSKIMLWEWLHLSYANLCQFHGYLPCVFNCALRTKPIAYLWVTYCHSSNSFSAQKIHKSSYETVAFAKREGQRC